jgi:hypothetical protein
MKRDVRHVLIRRDPALDPWTIWYLRYAVNGTASGPAEAHLTTVVQ